MDHRRREIVRLIPALAAFAAAARAEEKAALPAKAYSFEELPVRKDGGNSYRAIFDGLARGSFRLELHETELAAGSTPHPPHHHAHEEMFLIREGQLEVTLDGRATRLGPGSAAFVASNIEHGIRNIGSAPAQYFVLALGSDQSSFVRFERRRPRRRLRRESAGAPSWA